MIFKGFPPVNTLVKFSNACLSHWSDNLRLYARTVFLNEIIINTIIFLCMIKLFPCPRMQYLVYFFIFFKPHLLLYMYIFNVSSFCARCRAFHATGFPIFLRRIFCFVLSPRPLPNHARVSEYFSFISHIYHQNAYLQCIV